METALKTKRRHYPLPAISMRAPEISAALDGDIEALWGAFFWHETPQEHEFWSYQVHDGLTDEGRAILESWLEQLQGEVADTTDLRAALEFYAKAGDYKAGGAVWLDCGAVARAALGIEAGQ